MLPPPPPAADARPLLRSLIVVRLMCSNPSFRLWRIGFASGFDLISFRCSSFNWPPLVEAGFGGATRGSVALWSNALLRKRKRKRIRVRSFLLFNTFILISTIGENIDNNILFSCSQFTCKLRVIAASWARRGGELRTGSQAWPSSLVARSVRSRPARGVRARWSWAGASQASRAPRIPTLWGPWSRLPVASARCNLGATVSARVRRPVVPDTVKRAREILSTYCYYSLYCYLLIYYYHLLMYYSFLSSKAHP